MFPTLFMGNGNPIRQRLYLLTTDFVADLAAASGESINFTRNRMSELTIELEENSEYLLRGMIAISRPGDNNPAPGVRFSRSGDIEAAYGFAFGTTRQSTPENDLAWARAGTVAFHNKDRLVLDTDDNGNRRVNPDGSSLTVGIDWLAGPFFYIKTGVSPVSIYTEGYSDSVSFAATYYAGSYIIVEKLS